MKHLFNFDTVAEYDAAKDTLEQPYVVVIDENNGLQYNTDVIRLPEGSCGGAEIEEYWEIDESKIASGESMYYTVCLAYTSRIKNNGQIMPSGMLALSTSGITGCKYTPLYDITSANGLDSLRQVIMELDKNIPGVLNFFDKVFTSCTEEEFYALS